jgi:hypothetical protein
MNITASNLRRFKAGMIVLFGMLASVTFATATFAEPPAPTPDCSIVSCTLLKRPLTSILFGTEYKDGSPKKLGDTNTIVNTVINNRLLPFIYFVMAGAAVILLIVAGIRYIVSGGSPDVTKKARQSIINIVLGIAILTAAYAIISLILGVLNFIATKAT